MAHAHFQQQPQAGHLRIGGGQAGDAVGSQPGNEAVGFQRHAEAGDLCRGQQLGTRAEGAQGLQAGVQVVVGQRQATETVAEQAPQRGPVAAGVQVRMGGGSQPERSTLQWAGRLDDACPSGRCEYRSPAVG